jgi:hypothetical protein
MPPRHHAVFQGKAAVQPLLQLGQRHFQLALADQAGARSEQGAGGQRQGDTRQVSRDSQCPGFLK